MPHWVHKHATNPRIHFLSALEHCGIPIFIDQNRRIGDLRDTTLEHAISNAFAVIPIRTPSSVQSRWVRLESQYALRMGILCPVLRKACVPPLEVSDIEFANLTDWEPDNTRHVEWNSLVSSLRHLQHTNNQSRPGSEADLCFRLVHKSTAPRRSSSRSRSRCTQPAPPQPHSTHSC
ncbi:MAG: toll/interleukin-1 receptor domain-containing protein [Planctomyces sp.]